MRLGANFARRRQELSWCALLYYGSRKPRFDVELIHRRVEFIDWDLEMGATSGIVRWRRSHPKRSASIGGQRGLVLQRLTGTGDEAWDFDQQVK